MTKSRLSEEQIAYALRQMEGGRFVWPCRAPVPFTSGSPGSDRT